MKCKNLKTALQLSRATQIPIAILLKLEKKYNVSEEKKVIMSMLAMKCEWCGNFTGYTYNAQGDKIGTHKITNDIDFGEDE